MYNFWRFGWEMVLRLPGELMRGASGGVLKQVYC